MSGASRTFFTSQRPRSALPQGNNANEEHGESKGDGTDGVRPPLVLGGVSELDGRLRRMWEV